MSWGSPTVWWGPTSWAHGDCCLYWPRRWPFTMSALWWWKGNVEILAAVHLAANLIDAAMGNRDAPSEGSLDMAFLERAGLAADVPAWWDKARSTVETATSSN